MACHCIVCCPKPVVSKAQAVLEPKTQKAIGVINGINSLCDDVNSSHYLIGKFNYLELIKSENDILLWTPRETFARPCPKTPRHGFVDSRGISTKEALKSLLNKVLEKDPEGEILLTPSYPKVCYNAIYSTSGVLSVGPDNDGATAGKNSISLPVAPTSLKQEILSKSALTKKDTAYLEAIFLPDDICILTQIRGGPGTSTTQNFIPRKIRVKKVIKPCEDLLDWESQVTKLKPGTVVYGEGHTLASHAAIHCAINKVPFVTTFKPKIGDLLKPELLKEAKFDQKLFKKGVAFGLENNTPLGDMTRFSLVVLHNSSYLKTSPHFSWLLGVASIFLIKVLSALNFGEYRHFDKSEQFGGLERSTVYEEVAYAKDLASYLRQSKKVMLSFLYSKRGGYGGKKWATATFFAIKLWNTVAQLHNSGRKKTASSNVISLMNKIVNLVHNNGWIFNKVQNAGLFDAVAKRPGIVAMARASDFYKAHEGVKKISVVTKPMTVISENGLPFSLNTKKGLRFAWVMMPNKVFVKEGTKTKSCILDNVDFSKKFKYEGVMINKLYLRTSGPTFLLPNGSKLGEIK